ncbi:Ornithine decarboxylase [Actinidia chinensis var. chinensis]|uniref:ornithine decarboxylase n=1 Tax=Actinidia chinensis var. chinensis TaxID=1590841 RepID=A0A2R6RMG6_ACTCC|nr:Ornithine decarboxylase [Actinidia chinensis var. chinensis]
MVSSPTTLQVILGAPVVREKKVTALPKDGLDDLIRSIIFNTQQLNEPFYVLDLGVVASLVDKWTRSLPTVRPFYAVKCNPEPALLGVMEALGASFDCASRAEIETVLSLGVSPSRIIYANPCKPESHIKYAASVGVNLTTFDSLEEIQKIQKHHPNCDLLIRIKAPDDGNARCPLGPKYGALPEEVEPLLQAVKASGLAVAGVSFHIGSGATNSNAYRSAIAAAKSVFDAVSRLDMPRMHVLNIGGGFTAGPEFDDAANAVNSAVYEYFKNEPGLTLIAEPGRFFAETAFTLATNIFGKRVRGEVREYWINDGVYGSMNCILYDHATVMATPFACSSNGGDPTCDGAKTYCSTVFGPTCDALDTVLRDYQLPELQVNDWLVFPNMGAYTAAAGSSFNGFNTAAIGTHLAYSNSVKFVGLN